MRLLSLIIIGGISYYTYTKFIQPQTVIIDEKYLPNIKKLDHDKSYNPLYDPSTNTNVQIVHHFKSEVMPGPFGYAVM